MPLLSVFIAFVVPVFLVFFLSEPISNALANMALLYGLILMIKFSYDGHTIVRTSAYPAITHFRNSFLASLGFFGFIVFRIAFQVVNESVSIDLYIVFMLCSVPCLFVFRKIYLRRYKKH